LIYSFKCECGNTRDVEQSIYAEVVEPMCTDCQESMYRCWSPTATIFKGKGFYSTDER